MPEYEWTGDHSEIPSLGLTVKHGDHIFTEEPVEHPNLKLVTRRKAAEKSRPTQADTTQPVEAETPEHTETT